MILVTGASGTIGSALVSELCARGAAVRVFVRDARKVAQLPPAVERAVGDLDAPDTLRAAMRGIERVFLLSPAIDPAQLARSLSAAEAEGVRHVVKLSTLEAATGSDGIARWHRAEEQQVQASGLSWTFVRAGNFASNALNWAASMRSDSTVFAATGDGQSAPIDPRDIAAVLALALTGPAQEHAGQAYPLTGPELLSVAQQVAILSDVLHKPLRVVDVDPDSMGAQLRSRHAPDVLVDALVELWKRIRAGDGAHVSDCVPKLLGRPARTFEQWAREHAAAFA
jgi:(4-alkanoyl-5-oxo-2,5-dihydrofuran-3-yl)methyl phosphate reductase